MKVGLKYVESRQMHVRRKPSEITDNREVVYGNGAMKTEACYQNCQTGKKLLVAKI